MMNCLIQKMNTFTDVLIANMDEESLSEAMVNFQYWQNSRNKHEVFRFYSDLHFGIYYTKRLFRSRVECFHEVLVTVSLVSEVKAVMKQNLDVTSFGCGPGPEIAAYVTLMRNQCNVQDRLSFLAVDKIDYWRQFVKMTDQSDRNVFIRFDNAELNISYLNRLNPSGVCIMSYPESVNFGDIWTAMKRYFQLIILVDQSKYQLHGKLRDANFTIVPFHYKGSKHCAYYVAPIAVAPAPRKMSITTIPPIRQISATTISMKIEEKAIPRIPSTTMRPITPDYSGKLRSTVGITKPESTAYTTIPKSIYNFPIQTRSSSNTTRPRSPDDIKIGRTNSITKPGSTGYTAVPTGTNNRIPSQRTNDIDRAKRTNRVPSPIGKTQHGNGGYKPQVTEHDDTVSCCTCTIL